MDWINGDACHDRLVLNTKGTLSYNSQCDYEQWKSQVENKLRELLGTDTIEENACPVRVKIEEETIKDTYRLISFCYESERENWVPAFLLIPNGEKKKYPLAIVLQGHTSGYHISIGVTKYEGDQQFVPNSSFALQAVENGFAVLCIEQRGMGATRSHRYPGPGGVHQCSFTAMTAINLGRTVIGERVWDVSRGIDALEKLAYPEIDLSKIMIQGTSGGGTAAFYAACLERRIGIFAGSLRYISRCS